MMYDYIWRKQCWKQPFRNCKSHHIIIKLNDLWEIISQSIWQELLTDHYLLGSVHCNGLRNVVTTRANKKCSNRTRFKMKTFAKTKWPKFRFLYMWFQYISCILNYANFNLHTKSNINVLVFIDRYGNTMYY